MYDQVAPAGYDPHSLAGYDEVEAFFQRDFIGELPLVKDHLLENADAAATALEAWFAQLEDAQEAALEARRADLQARLVRAREGIEQGLADAQDKAKWNIAGARDAFVADVTSKRGAVEHAIASLKEAHYGNEGEADQRDLLYEIHEAKEAFATAVQDARTEFDLVLSTAREASEGRLAAGRAQFEADLTRKRGDLDAAITGLRTQLADQAAAKREALGLMLKAAWEDMEEAISEAADYFGHAVEAKLAWINKVHYYGVRSELLEQVAQLRAAWTGSVTGLRQMFADQAEDRRLAAEAAIGQDQDDFEVAVAGVLATCDANRAAESGVLEAALSDRRLSFDELLGECRGAIASAIDAQIGGLKEFLQSQYGYQGHQPGPYSAAPQGAYFDDDYVDAVQEYVDHVTAPQAKQAAAAVDWLGKRKEALKAGLGAAEDDLEAFQQDRAAWEAQAFADQVDAAIQGNGDLAAGLLADVQAANDAIQTTLEDLKHEHYGYQDMHGYRYKLLAQLNHQREQFEHALEAAWITWTQSRDLALETAAANAGASADAFEGFLATKLGEWENAANQARGDLAAQISGKGEALKGAVQEATKVFQEKQAYKRHYIAGLEDAEK